MNAMDEMGTYSSFVKCTLQKMKRSVNSLEVISKVNSSFFSFGFNQMHRSQLHARAEYTDRGKINRSGKDVIGIGFIEKRLEKSA